MSLINEKAEVNILTPAYTFTPVKMNINLEKRTDYSLFLPLYIR